MNTLLILLLVLTFVLFAIVISTIIAYLVFTCKGLNDEPVTDKENRIIYKKNVHTSCTFLLDYRGGVRSFNRLFNKKQLKQLGLKDDRS